MTTPFVVLFVLVVMPYVLAGLGGYLRIQQLGSADNNHPRVQALQLQGIAARAWAAQQNAWEALAVFGSVAIVGHLVKAEPHGMATASLVFLATRLLHPIFYLANLAPLRTLTFVIGLLCIIRMMMLCWAPV